jgi:hypothetical protein
MIDDSKSIWLEHRTIMRARMEKNTELMREYDKTVYLPALKDVQERCGKVGHARGKFDDNGFGWSWYWCNRCGARFDIEGPDAQEEITQ